MVDSQHNSESIAVNPFLMSSAERLADWKDLRARIGTMADQDALTELTRYWAQAPLSVTSHDPENPSTWPTPWEMISRGEWSKPMVAVGMEFTLRLAGWSEDRLKLRYLRDYDISEEIMILIVDDKIVLNYTDGAAIEYPPTEQIILCRWQHHGKEYAPILG